MHYQDKDRGAGCGSTIFTLFTVVGVAAIGTLFCMGNMAFGNATGEHASAGLVLVAIVLFVTLLVVMTVVGGIVTATIHTSRPADPPVIINNYVSRDRDKKGDDEKKSFYDKV